MQAAQQQQQQQLPKPVSGTGLGSSLASGHLTRKKNIKFFLFSSAMAELLQRWKS
jgi:hypothetical protein